MTAARPLSDMAGLAATVVVQAMAVTAGSVGALGAAALCAGLAAGVRSQVVWLTVPVLVLAVHQRSDRRIASARRSPRSPPMSPADCCGESPWSCCRVARPPTWRALANQGTEDFTGVAMLADDAVAAAARAGAVLRAASRRGRPGRSAWRSVAAAAVRSADCGATRARGARLAGGGVRSVLRLRPVLSGDGDDSLRLAARRARSAFLAVRGLAALPRPVGMSLAVRTAAASLLLAQPALAAYARTAAPAFRLLADMRATSDRAWRRRHSPVLAMHRRQELDLRRPSAGPAIGCRPWTEHLPAPPKHEWLELVKYWNRGGRAPIWFRRRSAAQRSGARRPRVLVTVAATYRWPFAQTDLIGGVRPNVMDWHLIAAARLVSRRRLVSDARNRRRCER